jgi:hypothetical protein
MDHPTSDPTVTDHRTLVRADLGGWLSGPCLATHLPPEAAQPPVLRTVLTVARLGQELPSWRVAETSAGWTAIRVPAEGGEPLRLLRSGLHALEDAMTLAELAIVKAGHPGWSIRRTEHGRGFTGQAGGPPTLHGHTLGELDTAITRHEQRPGPGH